MNVGVSFVCCESAKSSAVAVVALGESGQGQQRSAAALCTSLETAEGGLATPLQREYARGRDQPGPIAFCCPTLPAQDLPTTPRGDELT